MRRAHHPEQKETRRQSVLDATERLLDSQDFHALRMVDLAQELGLAKGTLYTYFPTKEALFLALLMRHMEGWFTAAGRGLEALQGPASPADVAHALVSPLGTDPLLPKLIAILHAVLEQNLSVEEVIRFKRFLLGGVSTLAPRVESMLPSLPTGTGFLALLRLHGLVVGFQSMAQRPPAVDAALREPDLMRLAMDFTPTLESTLTDLLAGMTRP